jgi:alkaline phosphatase
MRRRDFLRSAGMVGVGGSMAGCFSFKTKAWEKYLLKNGAIKNIIFLVSDGMSSGTLQMADLLSVRKYGKNSNWINLYKQNAVSRGLMDMASLNSAITDSAAASSAWGGGHRVKNGSLNIGPNGEEYMPILQKFKSVGKAVGCVTTVPITHATPAGFCINIKSRDRMETIAELYLDLEFDVMMGGGTEVFSAERRKDKQDLFKKYKESGYVVATEKAHLLGNIEMNKPLLGVFHESALPYALDHAQDNSLIEKLPTLAEMTKVALNKLGRAENGFVLQVEGGQVDWAAHANDSAGLLYDQIAFDECIQLATDFADKNEGTMVIITTDHGNANPGLLYGSNSHDNFAKLFDFKASNKKILQSLSADTKQDELRDIFISMQNIEISKEHAEAILKPYLKFTDQDKYDDNKLPYDYLATIQKSQTNIGWAGQSHTGDYVEICVYGAGKELLPAFILNTELHYFMLEAVGVEAMD